MLQDENIANPTENGKNLTIALSQDYFGNLVAFAKAVFFIPIKKCFRIIQ